MDTQVFILLYLGCILHGTNTNVIVRTVLVNNICTTLTSSEECLHHLRELHMIGINNDGAHTTITARDQNILKNFSDTFEIQNRRGVVALLWKLNVQLTSDNYHTAVRRFAALRRNLLEK